MIYNLNFVKKVLPDLENDEVLYMYVQARKKYYKELQTHDPVVGRTLIYKKDIDEINLKIKRLNAMSEIAIDRKTNKNIPKFAFTVYIDINPKSIKKGMMKFIKEYLDYLLREEEKPFNPRNRLMANIHKSNSRKLYVIIDIDKKSLLNAVLLYTPSKLIVWISETQGGYHIILRNEKKEISKLFQELNMHYSSLIKNKVIEFKRTCTTPVPGTIQNNFYVDEISI